MAKELKYKINEFLNKLPHSISIGDFVKKLEAHRISKDSFYRDRKITKKSKASIPSDRLLIYAKLLGCTLDELLNYDVKVKSIHPHVSVSTPKHKTGLS